jgi:hypothetical protein
MGEVAHRPVLVGVFCPVNLYLDGKIFVYPMRADGREERVFAVEQFIPLRNLKNHFPLYN